MARATIYPKIAGIYKFTNKHNNKVYIGKSVDLSKRLIIHKNTRLKSRRQTYFEHAIIKYGWDSFTLDILETFPEFDKKREEDKIFLLKRESYYISEYKSTDKAYGYNLCEYSNDNTGRSLTEEHKEKIRIANTGKKMSLESIEKTRAAHLGVKLSEEHRKKLSQSKIGKKRGPHSEEHKEKLRQANLGKKMSLESREKMRQANLGKKLPDWHKEKLRLARLGVSPSLETVEKIRKGNLGRKHSPESIEKMRQAKLGKKKKPKLEENEQHFDTTTDL